MSENVKRVGRDLIYRGAIIEVYQDHMEFANGNKADWDYIHHDGAAAVVPVLEDGRILMVRQYRTALGREALEIPARKLDGADEEGIVCAARELEEETGYRCENLEWLLTLRPTIAYCDEKIQIFLARDLIPSRQHLDEDEYVDVQPYDLEELKERIFAGQIEDAKTIAALLTYEAKYLRG